MRSSLRRAVVGRYTLLALVAFGLFGTALHLRVRQALFAQADASLEGHARAIAATVEFDLLSGWELGIADAYLARVEAEGWFEVLDPKGAVVQSGGTLPAAPLAGPDGLRKDGAAHEYVVAGPRGTRVRVGRSVAAELAELRELLAVTWIAGTVLSLGILAGGWWSATRALRPVAAMSASAARISATDLSQRIDPRAVPGELRELATTLNGTFERLELAFERQTRFSADVSHELRTPLSVIRAQVEQALRRERTGEEYRLALQACLRSTERMSRLVEQMLAFARLEGDAAGSRNETVALDAVLRDALEEAAGSARAAEIGLHGETVPARVRGDSVQLAEVFANLLSNAIRYNQPRGRVDAVLRLEDGCAVVRVADEGIGIPPEAQPHVFERFFQVDPARPRAAAGAGLGLALVDRIVRAHGGTISVESRPGAGSTFTVRLPALPPDAADTDA